MAVLTNQQKQIDFGNVGRIRPVLEQTINALERSGNKENAASMPAENICLFFIYMRYWLPHLF
ncbi:hypothetical protein [Acinetobacter baumannii]|uniref:hypothetical protein n=1 Tax=Acinetobacter baumannii TaxID=470 RepID=UPI000F09BB35|nr:hypothetical protein [Acinetobacter baumannii]RNC97471.1 hypothetical protein ED866_19275 [Acinetobacter baumannii]